MERKREKASNIKKEKEKVEKDRKKEIKKKNKQREKSREIVFFCMLLCNQKLMEKV